MFRTIARSKLDGEGACYRVTVMLPARGLVAAVAVGVLVDCSGPIVIVPPDAGGPIDAGFPCATCAVNQVCDQTARACLPSPIQHVVLIVQENHTFDSYFGRWCKAPAGSNPTCTAGRTCCEGAPALEPGGASPGVLDDDSNLKHERDHEQECELQQIHGGLMDRFVSGASGSMSCLTSGPKCSDPLNWVLGDGTNIGGPLSYYWTLADSSALADRYFQPVAGGSASNDIYFAGAHFRFVDNARLPAVAAGTNASGPCDQPVCEGARVEPYPAPTVADLLLDAGYTFSVYADGYDAALAASQSGACPVKSSMTECPYRDCVAHPVACYGCVYDPSDIPFLYFRGFADDDAGMPTPYERDLNALQTDLAAGKLPSFAFVKLRLFRNEHPNMSTITDGAEAVSDLVNRIHGSSAWSSTLVLLTWDEGGGFFDHVSPPPPPPVSVDNDTAGMPIPYGTRVPFLAIGPFAASGQVSHVTLEHSSVVRFLELNFLGATGQLHARDGYVNNLGSLLDPKGVGYTVP
jgi:phospholipase C